MRRARVVIALLALGLLAAPLSEAQLPAKVHRVGVLHALVPSATWRARPQYRAFLEGLRQLGYVEGENLAIEFRSAEGKFDRLPELATELVGLRLDVIFVATCGAPLEALRRATHIIPIVVGACTADMVAAGIVASLARPGGNVTGLQKLNPELSAKRLELLKAVLPKASRVAVIWDPSYSDFAADWSAMRAAAQTLGVTLKSVEARGLAELETAFSGANGANVDGLITFADAITNFYAARIGELAAKARLPAVFAYRDIVDSGGLMSYGANIPDMFRRAAVFIDKILKGAPSGDLPVEQPTKIELAVNLKTAKALRITIPRSILILADKVIE